MASTRASILPLTIFQSTLSMRRAPIGLCTGWTHPSAFQSTLSMRRAPVIRGRRRKLHLRISIHALHEESALTDDGIAPLTAFQSTLSMRRAPKRSDDMTQKILFQSTLSMRRAPGDYDNMELTAQISIHALHEESAQMATLMSSTQLKFQSTLSMRRAPICVGQCVNCLAFQSTLSMRRAPRTCLMPVGSGSISIHALHEESAPVVSGSFAPSRYFNPRSP